VDDLDASEKKPMAVAERGGGGARRGRAMLARVLRLGVALGCGFGVRFSWEGAPSWVFWVACLGGWIGTLVATRRWVSEPAGEAVE
jgi:hypothetical protein